MRKHGTDTFPEGSTLRACGPDGCAALAKYWTEATYPALPHRRYSLGGSKRGVFQAMKKLSAFPILGL